LAAILIWYWIKKPGTTQQKLTTPPKPPIEEANDALRELTHSSLLKSGQFKQFYVDINQIIRHLFARVFHIHAEEMTSLELDEYLIGAVTEGALSPLFNQFQVLCDSVKYAKYDPVESDNNDIVNWAYAIVEEIRPTVNQEEQQHVATR